MHIINNLLFLYFASITKIKSIFSRNNVSSKYFLLPRWSFKYELFAKIYTKKLPPILSFSSAHRNCVYMHARVRIYPWHTCTHTHVCIDIVPISCTPIYHLVSHEWLNIARQQVCWVSFRFQSCTLPWSSEAVWPD